MINTTATAWPPFAFGPQVCGQLDGAASGAAREWLVTDGLGGYAMGTVSGLRTRRYHALLVVPTDATRRRVGLVALDPVVTFASGARVRLAVHEWASGALDPDGHRYLERVDFVDGLPRWRWRIGDVVLERELAMAYGRSSLGVVHRLVSAPAPVRVTLDALCTWRDAGAERGRGDGPLTVANVADGVIVEGAYRIAGPGWRTAGQWWHDAYAREEAARGLTATEDLWHAGTFAATLAAGSALEVSAWAGDLRRRPATATSVVAAARRRARTVLAAAKPADEIDATLALAADAFVVKGPDVVAGYPWFGPWLRDTMTAYEGLFLRTGRAVEGAALLRRHAGVVADGGVVPAEGCDGPLWLVHAVDRHVTGTGDTHLGAELLDQLQAVLATYAERRAPWAARLDARDGLLALDLDTAGTTWMNAYRDGHPVTPRDGKPVELNALWVNALGAVARLAERLGRDAGPWWTRHEGAQRSFAKRYTAPGGWLYDLIDATPAAYPLGGGDHYDDPVLRPNQLLAYSLPYAPLDGADPRAAQAVGAALLTPLGLRSLGPAEYGYQGSYGGGVAARDEAYHQGTVWPWLIGPYVDACRVAGTATDGVLRGLETHLGEWGLGSVSEVADGDAPHRAGGCPFSARAVGELIRARAALRARPRATTPGRA